jgi:hypothetical protein
MSEYMPERMSDRMSEKKYIYIDICHIYFQMECQKHSETMSDFVHQGGDHPK